MALKGLIKSWAIIPNKRCLLALLFSKATFWLLITLFCAAKALAVFLFSLKRL